MLKISQQTTIKLIVAINTLANLHFFYFKALPLPIASPFHTCHIPGTLPRAKERRTVAFLTALACRRPVRVSLTVHQIVPS